VALLASRLKPGGYLHLATDWEDYAQQMLEVLRGEPLLENTADDFAPRPDYASADEVRIARTGTRARRPGPAVPAAGRVVGGSRGLA
jgi:tRNA G46 methylase TrmB